jgi:hypothetical protein
MRPALFGVLTACATAPTPPDGEVPARLTCATGAFATEFPVTTIRGTLVATADGFDVAFDREMLRVGAPGEPPAESFVGVALAGDTLAITAGALTATLAPTPAGLWTGDATVGDAATTLTCWPDDHELPVTYEDGRCERDDGEDTLLTAPVPYFRETGVGRCVDFGAVDLSEGEYGYPDWVGADLRGADLSAASMHFAYFTDARLEGAQLAGFDFGYVGITGAIDAHTTIPPDGCTVTDNTIDCLR